MVSLGHHCLKPVPYFSNWQIGGVLPASCSWPVASRMSPTAPAQHCSTKTRKVAESAEPSQHWFIIQSSLGHEWSWCLKITGFSWTKRIFTDLQQPSPLQMLAAQNQRKLPSELCSQVKKAKGGTWFDRKRETGIWLGILCANSYECVDHHHRAS